MPLGVLPKSEMSYEDMFEIMSHYQTYVPKIQQEKLTDPIPYHHILFGGDALTVCRQRGLQNVMKKSDNQLLKCNGIIPVIEDWHTKVTLLEVYINLALNYSVFLFTVRFTI